LPNYPVVDTNAGREQIHDLKRAPQAWFVSEPESVEGEPSGELYHLSCDFFSPGSLLLKTVNATSIAYLWDNQLLLTLDDLCDRLIGDDRVQRITN
jgi:hypothetical protein